MLGAKLRAGASRAFADVSAHKLADTIVPLDVDARPNDPLELADWLRARRETIAEPDEVSLAVAVVEHARSHPEIRRTAELAEQAGLAVRALQRLFRDFVGASPKWVIRR